MLLIMKMCLFFKNNDVYQSCSFCHAEIDEDSPYIFKVVGLGKYNDKYICIDCLLDKLLN